MQRMQIGSHYFFFQTLVSISITVSILFYCLVARKKIIIKKKKKHRRTRNKYHCYYFDLYRAVGREGCTGEPRDRKPLSAIPSVRTLIVCEIRACVSAFVRRTARVCEHNYYSFHCFPCTLYADMCAVTARVVRSGARNIGYERVAPRSPPRAR